MPNPDTTVGEEEGSSDSSLSDIATKCAAIAVNQIRTAVIFRQERLDNITKNEELYYNKKSKSLRGRFNFPIPIMSGFVDTLMSKIDDEPNIEYSHTEEADKIKAKKISAAWKFDSAPTRGAWSIKDLLVKKLAIFSGRGIYKTFSESDPVYKNYFEPVDAFDFIAEPGGGWHLEDHRFCGQQNVFRSKFELEQGVKDERYNGDQVKKLIAAGSEKNDKVNQDLYRNRQKRFENIGMNIENNSYVGQTLYCLTEYVMEYENVRYYMILDELSGTWIRFGKLKDIFGSNKLPWKSWATHYDAWNFWSKAPADDIRPVAEALKTIVNFMFDDVQKRLWGQRFYDPEMITDPSQLEWDRPDKLVQMYVPQGKQLSEGVYEIPMGDQSTVTINLIDYFKNLIATESGVTDGAKGNSDDKFVGIAQLNVGEAADRFGLYNKFYRQCWAELGEAYLEGLIEHMTQPRLIRMIGEHGIGWKPWQTLTLKELKFEQSPDVRITGGTSQAKLDQEKKTAKAASLTAAATLYPALFNPKRLIENLLLNGEWGDDEITSLLDVNSDGNEEELVRASQAIQDILDGKKKVEPYRGATTLFVNKVLNFAKMEECTPKQRVALIKYAEACLPIAKANMDQKAQQVMSQRARTTPPTPTGVKPQGNSVPTPYMPPATAPDQGNAAGGGNAGTVPLIAPSSTDEQNPRQQ